MISKELMEKGMEVFEDKSKFYQWLITPIQVFNDMAPIEQCQSVIVEELLRIQHGIYS